MTGAAAVSDEELGRQALAGDRDAFAELFGRHEAGLFNVAHRLTGNRDDAADITQEAFLRVFARLDDLAGREVNLAAYLHRTARNLVYDRSAQRVREAPTGEMEWTAGADEALEADPHLSTLVSAQGRDVQAANARLPERHRLVLALRELEDMGYDDIGRVLDITPGAVAQLLSRARMALRRELRLQQVDLERMDPACRARMGEIGALIDGELDADRALVLADHLAACDACRAARASFEDARVTYRAWLPLPILGLGDATARAAEGRDLVRFSDGAAGRGGAGRGGRGGGGERAGGGAGGPLGGRRRAVAAAAGGLLALLLLVGVPTLVATRSGSGDPPPPRASPAVAPAAATTGEGAPAAAPAATTVPSTAGTTVAPPTPAPPPAPAGAPAPGGAAAALAPAPAPGTTARARVRTSAPVRRAPAAPAGGAATEPPPPAPAEPPPPATTEPPPTAAPPTPDPPTTPTRPIRPRPPVFTGPFPTIIEPPPPPPPVIE